MVEATALGKPSISMSSFPDVIKFVQLAQKIVDLHVLIQKVRASTEPTYYIARHKLARLACDLALDN